jgi:hypothetical protein
MACALALFSRETTLIFALAMFMAVRLGGDRRRGIVISVALLVGACLLFLMLRVGFTTGYEHQIDPGLIVARLVSPNFPEHFFVQLLLGQGLLILLVLGIALRRPRYACYLLAAAAIMAIVALATDVTDVGLLVGESLPFYAVIFILAWSGHLPRRASAKLATPGAGEALG